MANKTINMLQIRRIIQLKEQGKSNRQIAREVGLSRDTVSEYIRRIEKTGIDLGNLFVLDDEQDNDVLNFVLNDHLGSIQVLANAAGQLLEEFSYDAWGQRRDPVTLAVYAWATMPVTGMDYGFTGHEHLDIFMLVNMNSRIYDPSIGRFLSPDPVLQFPNFTQGLNP